MTRNPMDWLLVEGAAEKLRTAACMPVPPLMNESPKIPRPGKSGKVSVHSHTFPPWSNAIPIRRMKKS